MPSRRRKTTTHKMTAQAAPEAQDSRPPVTQVVEVIEEDVVPVSAEPVQEPPPVEEPPPPEETTTGSGIITGVKVVTETLTSSEV